MPPRRSNKLRRAAAYAALAVLPSASLAWLGFANLETAREERLRAQRAQAQAALEALASDLHRQVELRLARERERPFYEYEEYYRPIDAISPMANFVLNPLATSIDPVIRARWQAPRAPGSPSFDKATLSVLPRDEGCRLFVEQNWLSTIESEALRPEEQQQAEQPAICQVMPREVMASNRMQAALRSRVERAQSGAREDNQYLGEAEQAWRNETGAEQPAMVASYLSDLGQRLITTPTSVELLSLREVQLPAIPRNETTGALAPARVLQGVVLDLRSLFEESVRSVAPYLRAEGIALELGFHAFAPAPDSLSRLLSELLRATPVSGEQSSLIARLDPAAIENAIAAQRVDLELLLGAITALVALASFAVFRSLRREWQLLEQQRAFVSAVTHELRTPVAGIRLYADLLQEGWVADDAQRQSFFGTLRGEADRLERLVDDVLHVAAFDRSEPRVLPELRVEELAPMVRAIAGEFRAAPSERPFELELDPLEEGLARLDRESLRRVLFNLLENAVKYTPLEREPRLRVRVRALERELRLEVEDNACGLRDEERRRIFEDFYRVGDEARRSARGAGLGLGVVRRHVEALGGRIEVESELGRGSVFRVILPRVP
ncbi:MAG: HAMP domain-containing histidine kinase [Planctomycetes bacterium]|nr:HAMP domain-containing histidine kinase [Planctomycetota bacterium]